MSLYEKSKGKTILVDKVKLRDLTAKTVNDMAAIVGATLGPGGRTVLIERDGMSPLISKDGVTVAKSLGVDNAESNIIIEACKEICINTGSEAGDGTTTAIVLANAITKAGLQFLESNPKYNPQRMANELQELYDNTMMPFLKQHAAKVKTDAELMSVALISANGDKEIAASAVEAVIAAGEDGTVLIQEARGSKTRVETLNGYVIATGLKDLESIGTAFINDRANQQARMDNGLVFVFDGAMNDLKIPAIIQGAVENTENYGKPIIVVAHKFSDVVLDKFAKTTKGGYTIVPVKSVATGTPNYQSMPLQDLATYTGANVYDPTTIDAAVQDEDVQLGQFSEATVNLFETFIMAEPDPAALEARLGELKAVLASAPEWDKMHIRAAIAKLTGGISTIWIGGASELEAREKKHRAEDAVEAVRSAIAEGIVPGGCAMHLVMADLIMNHPDFKPSWEIMVQALKAPFNLLLQNCGEDANDVWNALAPHILGKYAPPRMIFDANQHKLVDPLEAGIVEPAKVVRVSVGNALSVASLLITLGGIVVVPRDSSLENQLEMSKSAMREMMAAGGMGQGI